MKKEKLWFLVISFMCLILSTCKISVEDTDLMQKPDYDRSSKQVTLIIHKINSDTDYINIYRSEAGGSEIACGLLFPSDWPSSNQTYPFSDLLVKEEKKYKYRARYHDSKGYHYTNWTEEILIEGITDAYEYSDTLTYSGSSARFNFDSTDYTLALNTALTAPTAITDFDTHYKPMLLISKSDETQVFAVDQDFIEANKSISLRGLLPLSFMDRPIKILGILAEKKELFNPDETDESKQHTKFIYWTEPLPLKIYGKSDNTITVPAESGAAGHIYRSVQ